MAAIAARARSTVGGQEPDHGDGAHAPSVTTGPDVDVADNSSVTVELEVRRVALDVVVRWAAVLGLTTVAVWWAAVALFWVTAAALGMTGRFEALVRDIGFEGFRLTAGPVFLALALLGVAWVLGVALVAVVAAAAYNAYARVIGGLTVTAVETVTTPVIPDA